MTVQNRTRVGNASEIDHITDNGARAIEQERFWGSDKFQLSLKHQLLEALVLNCSHEYIASFFRKSSSRKPTFIPNPLLFDLASTKLLTQPLLLSNLNSYEFHDIGSRFHNANNGAGISSGTKEHVFDEVKVNGVYWDAPWSLRRDYRHSMPCRRRFRKSPLQHCVLKYQF